MTAPAADVVVVGAGVVGAAIALHLARLGRRVIVCEQDRAGARGATARSGGLLRLYHAHPADIALAARSLGTFRQFADLVGGDCGYRRTGFALLAGADRAAAVQRGVAAVRAAGHRAELADPGQLAARFPGLRLAGIGLAGYEPDGGYADPWRTARAFLAAATDRGARLLEGVRVDQVLTRNDRVVGVRSNVGDITGSTVVLAAGATVGRLARTVGVLLPVTGQRIGVALAAGSRAFEVPACIDDTTGHYFRPAGPAGLLFGVPGETAVVAGEEAALPSLAETTATLTDLRSRVPALAGSELVGTRAGVDGYTPDRRPLLGQVGPAGLYVAAGMSGGGFKIAPAVGELMAAEIHTGNDQSELADYRPQRFGARQPAVRIPQPRT